MTEQVGDLLREIGELSATESSPAPASEDRGVVLYQVRAYASELKRDEDGFITHIVGPDAVTTVVRDEYHRPVRLETEDERLVEE